jgi:hypothetical protein
VHGFADELQQVFGNSGKIVLDGYIEISVLFPQTLIDRALHRVSSGKEEGLKITRYNARNIEKQNHLSGEEIAMQMLIVRQQEPAAG